MRMLGCRIWCLRRLATRNDRHQKPLACRLTTAVLLNLHVHEQKQACNGHTQWQAPEAARTQWKCGAPCRRAHTGVPHARRSTQRSGLPRPHLTVLARLKGAEKRANTTPSSVKLMSDEKMTCA